MNTRSYKFKLPVTGSLSGTDVFGNLKEVLKEKFDEQITCEFSRDWTTNDITITHNLPIEQVQKIESFIEGWVAAKIGINIGGWY